MSIAENIARIRAEMNAAADSCGRDPKDILLCAATKMNDAAAVRVQILDEFGNPAPYAQIPVHFALEGAAELIGPSVVTAEGGMCGTFLRTVGTDGTARLTISTNQTAAEVLDFSVVYSKFTASTG